MTGFHYVYMLSDVATHTHHYVGMTEDLKARLEKHNSGQVPHTTLLDDIIGKLSRLKRRLIDENCMRLSILAFALCLQTGAFAATNETAVATNGVAAAADPLRTTRMPRMSFKPPATVRDAVSFFQEEARRHAATCGLTFVYRPFAGEDADAGAASAGADVVLPQMEATDISFADALRLVCESSDYVFRRAKDRVFVGPRPIGGCCVTRRYPLALADPPRDWTAWLKARGATPPEDARIVYLPETQMLRVTVCEGGFAWLERVLPCAGQSAGDE